MREVAAGKACDGTTGMADKTLVAFGDASIGQPRRGGGGPARRMRRACEVTFTKTRVFGVDEFLSSQRCHVCTAQLALVADARWGHRLRRTTTTTSTRQQQEGRVQRGDVVWGLKCVGAGGRGARERAGLTPSLPSTQVLHQQLMLETLP